MVETAPEEAALLVANGHGGALIDVVTLTGAAGEIDAADYVLL